MFQVVGERILWNGEQVAFLTVPEGVLRSAVVDALHDYDPDAPTVPEFNQLNERCDHLESKLDEIRSILE